jgi:heme A synthase
MESDRYHPGLHRWSILLALCTLLLVVAGGLVTSRDAGLSVPDWPLSYGKLMPPMEGGILYEHGHRMIATTVGLFTIVSMVWLFRVEKRRWMRWLGAIALLAVVAQGVLGGLTVIYLLPWWISSSHAAGGWNARTPYRKTRNFRFAAFRLLHRFACWANWRWAPRRGIKR